MKDIGLVLSGGGARATAQIGALQALHENGIYPTKVSGASAGALVGALYCNGYTPLEILDLSKTSAFLKIFKIGFINKDITEMNRLKTFLYNHIKLDFKDLEFPLYVSVSNLNTGRNEIISSGSIIDYVIASCSIPILFKPAQINNAVYVDGGLLNNFPVEPFLEKSDFIIGVSVSAHQYLPEINGRLDIAERCFHLAVFNTMKDRIKKCDALIEIDKVKDFSMFSTKQSDALFEIGYDAALKEMDSILCKLEKV